MNKSKKHQRGTGSTLDSGNLAIIVSAWQEVVKQDCDGFRGLLQTLGDKNLTSQLLWEHDPHLLKMFRNWTQATNMITAALAERVTELEQLIAAREAKLAGDAASKDLHFTPMGDNLNETH